MRTRKVGIWLRVCVVVLKPLLAVLTAPRWSGRERVPADGPVIFAVNHVTHADPLTVAHFVYDLPRSPRFLAKDSLFRVPLLGTLLRGTGQIPVYRGTRDASAALRAARDVLAAGGCVIIYPEGTTTKDPDRWPMAAKTGVGRLALESGAPVVPLAQWGAQALFDPDTHAVRLRWRVPITTIAGPPVDLSAFEGRPLTAEVLRGATEAVMDRIRTQLGEIRGQRAPDSSASATGSDRAQQ